MTVRLPRALADEMIAHARSELPNEACGIFGGTRDGELHTFHPARNADASPYRYTVHADDALRIVQRTAQALGLPLLSLEIELGPSQVEAVFDATRAFLCRLRRTDDPHQRARLGEMAVCVAAVLVNLPSRSAVHG